MNTDKIMDLLRKHEIPFEQEWGRGDAKTLNHFLKEIASGEAKLKVEKGRLVWFTVSAAVRVLGGHRDHLYELYEEKQVFADGRVRNRKQVLQASLMEKMKQNEDPYVAAVRAVREELGIAEDIRVILSRRRPFATDMGPKPSMSYPGLVGKYRMYSYLWLMPCSLFKVKGYVEVQPDKRTYFKWRKVTKGR